MVKFCGQDRCLIDANGRIKLPPRLLADFREDGPDVVLHCLPEGALGAYPPPVWTQMRQTEARPAVRAARSVVFRRELRVFGAMTQTERISNQGRITIPTHFRPLLDLAAGQEVMLVGCEIGVEIWNGELWQREFRVLWDHEARRGEAQMHADLGNIGPAGDAQD